MLSRRTALAFALLALLALSRAALADTAGTITAGSVSFTRFAYGKDPTVSFQVAGISSPNLLAAAGWWFRLAGDDHETPFPTPNSGVFDGPGADVYWNGLGGNPGILADEHMIVEAGASGSGDVQFSMYLENVTSEPVSLELFHYADVDVGGPTSNMDDVADYVEKTPVEIVEVTDLGTDRIEYQADHLPAIDSSYTDFPIAHQVAASSTLLDDLNDTTSVTDLTNGGAPFGPEDFTGAYQFSITLPPTGANYVLVAYVEVRVNRDDFCFSGSGIFCDGFETGDRSLWN